jgi:hypothetical protein
MSFLEKVRFWARHYSVRLAVLAGPIASVAVSYPVETAKLIEILPAPARAVAAIMVFSIIPMVARIKGQPKLGTTDGQ